MNCPVGGGVRYDLPAPIEPEESYIPIGHVRNLWNPIGKQFVVGTSDQIDQIKINNFFPSSQGRQTTKSILTFFFFHEPLLYDICHKNQPITSILNSTLLTSAYIYTSTRLRVTFTTKKNLWWLVHSPTFTNLHPHSTIFECLFESKGISVFIIQTPPREQLFAITVSASEADTIILDYRPPPLPPSSPYSGKPTHRFALR